MQKIFHLVYLSHAKEGISYSDIQNILNSSKKYNEKNEISGVLIFREGYFLQLLEGEQDHVLETIGRIIQDRRHHHFQVIIEATSNQRIFNSWTMNFLDGDTVCGVTEKMVANIMELSMSHKYNEKENILPMIKCFKKSTPEFNNS